MKKGYAQMKESYFQSCAGCASGVGIGWIGGGGRNPPIKIYHHKCTEHLCNDTNFYNDNSRLDLGLYKKQAEEKGICQI